jgi:hypothetical protein
MRSTGPILTERVRSIRGCTFGWVDHNFLHRGFLRNLTQDELLLYYFLITVADRNGVSFYDYERICQFLKMSADEYLRACQRLIKRSLIAVKDGVFQVLSLPEPVANKNAVISECSSTKAPQSLKDIFQGLGAKL